MNRYCSYCKRLHSYDAFCPRRVAEAYLGARQLDSLTEADTLRLSQVVGKINLIKMVEETIVDLA